VAFAPNAMPDVVFVVPFAMENTLRFVRAVGDVPGARLGLVSQEPPEQLPDELRRRLAGYERVPDAFNPDHLVEAARRLAHRAFAGNVDRLLGILEPLQEPLAVARERLGAPGMRSETARNFRDKARMKDLFRRHDLPCARHCLAETTQRALRFAAESGYPLVVKPPAGAGAKNTFRVDAEGQLAAYLRSAPPRPDAPVLLEEFILGEEFSFDSVSVRGRHVFHSISSYHPAPLEVMHTPWIQWCVLLPRDIGGAEYEPIRTAGSRALTCLGMDTGITHMEWFRRHDGSIAISEVAARPPGAQFMTLMSYAHGVDFYRAWAALMVHGHFTVPERRFATGAAYLRGQGTGRVVRILGLDEAQRKLGPLVVEAKLPQPGQAPAGSYEGEGYVILRHAETEVVRRGLQVLVGSLRVELG
jgi:biotin carboxylase